MERKKTVNLLLLADFVVVVVCLFFGWFWYLIRNGNFVVREPEVREFLSLIPKRNIYIVQNIFK